MKDVYFSHDAGARRDPKVLKLRSKYGAEGYGWYFMIVEILREQDDYAYPWADEYDVAGLAMELNTTTDTLTIFIEDCVSKFALLKLEDGKLFSESLNDRMDKMCEISEKRKVAAQKRWEATSDEIADAKKKSSNANAMQTDANAMQLYSKSTEKEKEIEIEKEKEYISTYQANRRGKPFGFNAILLALFSAQYDLSREIPYTAKRDRDEKHMNSIHRQYMELKKNRGETPDTVQTYIEMRLLFRLACGVVSDDWIFTNMSPPLLDSKFNQVMALIRKENGNNKNGTNSERKLTDQDIESVGARIFDLHHAAGAAG